MSEYDAIGHGFVAEFLHQGSLKGDRIQTRQYRCSSNYKLPKKDGQRKAPIF